jgi:uncharacterized protein with NRDE domain
MCILLLSYQMHPDYPLVLAANRDEYYDRPTKPLDYWDDAPDILAGRDLKNQGTWLGLARNGRIAAITNFREQTPKNKKSPSRGLLVSTFSVGNESPKRYLEHVKAIGHKYNGFNLIVGDEAGLFYYSNRQNSIRQLSSGVYGLSNRLLDTPWPKVERGKAAFEALISGHAKIHSEDIFSILKDKTRPPDDQLPDTGFDLDWERLLSPIFITSPFYGTRSSSIILMEKSGKITFWERTFTPDASGSITHHTRKISLVARERSSFYGNDSI